MTTMTITEWWSADPYNTGEVLGDVKDRTVWHQCGYASVAAAVKEVSSRFKHRLVYKGAAEVVFDNGLYVQRVAFT